VGKEAICFSGDASFMILIKPPRDMQMNGASQLLPDSSIAAGTKNVTEN
jgi:hypothetical protein